MVIKKRVGVVIGNDVFDHTRAQGGEFGYFYSQSVSKREKKKGMVVPFLLLF
jgi:hypothetical protein